MNEKPCKDVTSCVSKLKIAPLGISLGSVSCKECATYFDNKMFNSLFVFYDFLHYGLQSLDDTFHCMNNRRTYSKYQIANYSGGSDYFRALGVSHP